MRRRARCPAAQPSGPRACASVRGKPNLACRYLSNLEVNRLPHSSFPRRAALTPPIRPAHPRYHHARLARRPPAILQVVGRPPRPILWPELSSYRARANGMCRTSWQPSCWGSPFFWLKFTLNSSRRPYRFWSEPEIRRLIRLAQSGLSAGQIGRRLNRSRNSVATKCRLLGIKLSGRTGRPRRRD